MIIDRKRCGICKKSRQVKFFSLCSSKKDGLQTICKSCRKLYDAVLYSNNKDRLILRFRNRRRKIRQEFLAWKSTLCCEKCGENHIATLDFHHKDPSTKDSNISQAFGKGWSLERVKREAKKCQVLCSNCHRKLHHNEDINTFRNGVHSTVA